LDGNELLIRGRRNEPIKAIPKIITGNRANERLPNIVEWTRHSSFIMFQKRSGISILPDEGEEKGGKMLVPVF
jgi:hypothetical protein